MAERNGLLGGSPEEAFEAMVRKVIETDPSMPLVEFMTFSGAATDWRKDAGHILLRLTGRAQDESGQAHEVWARLVAPSGAWVVPKVETEMLVICPPQLYLRQGVAWAFHGAQLPPGKVDQETAYWPLDDTTTLLIKAGGFSLKCGDTMLDIDKTSGVAQISSVSKGTHIALDPVTNAIEMAVGDGTTTLAAFRLDATGISLSTQKADGTKKHVWKLDAQTGNFIGAGTGSFFAVYANGGLGKTPTIPIGNPTLISGSWGVTP